MAKNASIFLAKVKKYEILFLIIFLEIILLLRLANFSYSNFIVENPEANRDYLIAHNIVAYKDFISVGPRASVFHSPLGLDLEASPLYFYFLATFLLIKDNLLTLWFANVFLSLFTLVTLYLLARRMYGITTALAATILFGCSNLYANISGFYVWQPWIILPFINLSLFFLLLFYEKKNYALLLLGIFLLIFAGSIYYAALSFVPLFLVLIFFILRRENTHFLKKYMLAILTLIGSLVLFHLPLVTYFATNGYASSQIAELFTHFRESSPSASALVEPLNTALVYLGLLINSFFLNHGKDILSLNNILLFIIAGSAMYYISTIRKNSAKRLFFIITLLFILQPIILLSIFGIKPLTNEHTQPLGYGNLHYLALLFSLFSILISEVIFTSFSQSRLLKMTGLILFLALVSIASPTLQIDFKDTLNTISSRQVSYDSSVTQEAANAIEREILLIKSEGNKTDYSFFQLRTEGNYYGAFYNGVAYWNVLEKDLHTKFTKNSNQNPDRFVPINPDDSEYTFLFCYQYSSQTEEEENCVTPFLANNTIYKLHKHLYINHPLSIYAMKKQNLL